jgi:membrane-bound ClpP family serine protease
MSLLPFLTLRLMIGGIILIALGLFLFALKGLAIALALPAVGIILLLVGFIWKPKKKTENPQ